MQRFILAIGLIGAALMLQGCSKEENGKNDAATAAAIKKAVYEKGNADCRTEVKFVCDAVVGEASAAEIKKLADGGKIVCDGYGVGKLWANPTKYSACKAKLAHYQEAIGGHGYMTDAKNWALQTASLVGDWERACNDDVRKRVLWRYCCPAQWLCPKGGANATARVAKAIPVAHRYMKLSSSKTNWFSKGETDKLDVMKKAVTDNLAKLATYTTQYTVPAAAAPARLYDATVPTPADTYAPFVMVSLGVATVMVMGSVAVGLKRLLQNRQGSYSSTSMQNDEDEEEAAGDE